jgi:hypothetical protein
MLTTGQADHFRTFGFVVLRGFLADRAADLHAETDAAIRDAYAASYDERVVDGISGHYLPMVSRLTPVSASLVCDDPRFIDAAGQLLDGPVIPACPEGVLYFFEAGWHTDDGIGVRGVKFAAYFDELTAESGALRLVPGSHRDEQGIRLPEHVADTSPGDVIAFDLHTWHASLGGRDQLAWTIVYERCPDTGEERDRTLRSAEDGFEQAFRGFDRNRYPVWRDWLDDAARHPRRAPVIAGMRQAGVLDLPGARDGW